MIVCVCAVYVKCMGHIMLCEPFTLFHTQAQPALVLQGEQGEGEGQEEEGEAVVVVLVTTTALTYPPPVGLPLLLISSLACLRFLCLLVLSLGQCLQWCLCVE